MIATIEEYREQTVQRAKDPQLTEKEKVMVPGAVTGMDELKANREAVVADSRISGSGSQHPFFTPIPARLKVHRIQTRSSNKGIPDARKGFRLIDATDVRLYDCRRNWLGARCGSSSREHALSTIPLKGVCYNVDLRYHFNL